MATGGDSTDTAAFGDRTLDQNDVAGVVREIINVQTKSETLGRVLELSKGKVDSIHHQCSDSQKCLFGVIDEFVAQLEPRPTWRVILNALRDPLIGQTRLAEEIEKNHRQLPPAKNGIQYIPTKKKGEEAGESDGGRVLEVVEEKEGGEVEVAGESEGGEGEERAGGGVEEDAREGEGGEGEEREGGGVEEEAREREGGEEEEREGGGVEEEAREREGEEREGGGVEEEAREKEGGELIGQVERERETVPAAERRVGVAQSELKRRKNRMKQSNEIKAPNQAKEPEKGGKSTVFPSLSLC